MPYFRSNREEFRTIIPNVNYGMDRTALEAFAESKAPTPEFRPEDEIITQKNRPEKNRKNRPEHHRYSRIKPQCHTNSDLQHTWESRWHYQRTSCKPSSKRHHREGRQRFRRPLEGSRKKMIFLGLLPWNTYSAILKRGALQALLCVLKEEQCRNFLEKQMPLE